MVSDSGANFLWDFAAVTKNTPNDITNDVANELARRVVELIDPVSWNGAEPTSGVGGIVTLPPDVSSGGALIVRDSVKGGAILDLAMVPP